MIENALRTEEAFNIRKLSSYLRNIDFLLLATFVTCHLGNASTLFYLAGKDIGRYALLLSLICIIAATALAFLRMNIIPAVIAAAMLALIMWQSYVYSATTYVPTNFNTSLSYTPIAGFILFYNCRKYFTPAMYFVFLLYLAYSIIYVIFGESIVDLGSSQDSSQIQVLGGDERGARLVLANGPITFALFYCLAKARLEKKKLLWLLGAGIVMYSVYVSQSRTLTALLGVFSILFLLGLLTRPVQIIIAIVVGTCFAVILSGMIIPDWNPYLLVAGDSSGMARVISYQTLRAVLEQSFLFGLGFASDRTSFDAFVGREYVFWEDLGVFGVWVAYGLPGLLAFLFLAYLCLLGTKRTPSVSESTYQAIRGAALVSGVYTILAAGIWAGSASIIGNMVLALWLFTLDPEPVTSSSAMQPQVPGGAVSR